MRGFLMLLLVQLCSTTMVLGKLGLPGGPLKLHRDEIDTFKVILNYPSAVAIADTNKRAIVQCLAANRTEIDNEAQTATYVWTFQKRDNLPKKEITFYVKPGKKPGTLETTVGKDPTLKEAILYYADDNCIVMDVEDVGHHCLLWLRRELKNSVPQVCSDYFADICGIDVPEHSRDVCGDEVDDV